MKLFILLANHFRTLSKAASTRLLSANNGTFKSFNQIVGQGRKQLDAVFQVAQAKIGTSNQAPAEPRRAGLPEALQNCLPSHVSKPRMQFQKTGFCDFPHCALGIQTFRKALVGGILCLPPSLLHWRGRRLALSRMSRPTHFKFWLGQRDKSMSISLAERQISSTGAYCRRRGEPAPLSRRPTEWTCRL